MLFYLLNKKCESYYVFFLRGEVKWTIIFLNKYCHILKSEEMSGLECIIQHSRNLISWYSFYRIKSNNFKIIGPKRCISLTKSENVFTMIKSFQNHGKSCKINPDHLKISEISCTRIGPALTHTHNLYVLPKPYIESYLKSRGRWMPRGRKSN